jgi:uncharacterized protein with HEPN domain
MSANRHWRLRIEDIVEHAERIEQYIYGLDFESFVENQMLVDAVIRNLEVVGEAAHHVPPDIRARCPDVAWQLMNDMRTVLIHGYAIVDLAVVWDASKNNLPPTVDRLRRLLEDEDATEA